MRRKKRMRLTPKGKLKIHYSRKKRRYAVYKRRKLIGYVSGKSGIFRKRRL